MWVAAYNYFGRLYLASASGGNGAIQLLYHEGDNLWNFREYDAYYYISSQIGFTYQLDGVDCVDYGNYMQAGLLYIWNTTLSSYSANPPGYITSYLRYGNGTQGTGFQTTVADAYWTYSSYSASPPTWRYIPAGTATGNKYLTIKSVPMWKSPVTTDRYGIYSPINGAIGTKTVGQHYVNISTGGGTTKMYSTPGETYNGFPVYRTLGKASIPGATNYVVLWTFDGGLWHLCHNEYPPGTIPQADWYWNSPTLLGTYTKINQCSDYIPAGSVIVTAGGYTNYCGKYQGTFWNDNSYFSLSSTSGASAGQNIPCINPVTSPYVSVVVPQTFIA